MSGTPNEYTVVLIYPDYIADQYGKEFYIDYATANTPEEAIIEVQRLALCANDGSIDDPSDFALVACFRGHCEVAL